MSLLKRYVKKVSREFENNLIEQITIIFGGIATLAIFSYLWRENVVYRLFEHLFIGIATAVGIVVTLKNFLWPQVMKPLLGMDRTPHPLGGYFEPYNKLNLLFLIPMFFGMLYYFVLSKKHNWVAQIVIGFGFGVSGGLAFKGIFNEMLPQVFDSFRPLIVFDKGEFDIYKTISNWIFLFTLFSTLSYFIFTFKRKPNGLLEKFSNSGRWLLMGCFGAFFGSTIMARLALLVERLTFLYSDWFKAIKALFV